MGVQIKIELEDLIEAGWEIVQVEDKMFDINEEGHEVEIKFSYCIIEKGKYKFTSYLEYCFYADCNHWGRNYPMFFEAGLFSIPHTMG